MENEREVVKAAKERLMESFGLSEPLAYDWMLRASMDLRIPKLDIANRILEIVPPKG